VKPTINFSEKQIRLTRPCYRCRSEIIITLSACELGLYGEPRPEDLLCSKCRSAPPAHDPPAENVPLTEEP